MFFSFFQGMGFQVATFRDESSHLKDTISRKLLGCWPLCLLKCRLCHVVWTKNGMFYRYIFETKTIKSANQIAVDGSEIQLTTIKHVINNLVRYQAEVPFMFTMNLHLPSVCVCFVASAASAFAEAGSRLDRFAVCFVFVEAHRSLDSGIWCPSFPPKQWRTSPTA